MHAGTHAALQYELRAHRVRGARAVHEDVRRAGFDARRDIAGIITNRWGHAYVVDPPGFFFGKDGKAAPKDVLSKRFNRLSFGHSELTGVQMWETAAGEGERAAQQILEVS